MHCPNCKSERKLKTIETFDIGISVYRTKLCLDCLWKFVTLEDMTCIDTIPNSVRNVNRRKKDGKAVIDS